jgi:hypothetical protein
VHVTACGTRGESGRRQELLLLEYAAAIPSITLYGSGRSPTIFFNPCSLQ